MNFDVALKDIPLGSRVHEVLERTDRKFPCEVCEKVTGWRRLLEGCPGVPICSDECLDTFEEVQNEVDVRATPTPPPS